MQPKDPFNDFAESLTAAGDSIFSFVLLQCPCPCLKKKFLKLDLALQDVHWLSQLVVLTMARFESNPDLLDTKDWHELYLLIQVTRIPLWHQLIHQSQQVSPVNLLLPLQLWLAAQSILHSAS